jgi:imidazolonepropionase-like amidohydrolase
MKLAIYAAAIVVTAWLGIQPARNADVLYITAARLIVDVTRPPIPSGAVIIADGVVTAAGANVPIPAGARRIDAGALTIMPSLIDSHTHLSGGAPGWQPGRPRPIPSPGYWALNAQKSVARALSVGVAAMRDMQSDDFVDVAIAQAIDDGVIPGPHVIPAAHALSVIGGHEDFAQLSFTMDIESKYNPLHGFVASPAGAEKAAQLQIKYGARVIKLMASGGVGSPLDYPSDPNLTFDEMRAAVEQAHMHHLKAAAHAENLRSVLDALKAGVDSIEHGSELNQEATDYMKAHNVVLVPTVRVVMTSATTPPPGAPAMSPFGQFKAKQLLDKHLAAFALALKNGVTIAAGSDTAYPPEGTGVFAEVVTMVERGMSAQKALEAATIRGASLLELSTLGALTPGMEGDLMAVDGDPLSDIHALEKVRLVVFKGRVITNQLAGRAGPSQ